MKLVGVAMAKNEGDVIESFVRRNLRLLDHLVVIDHQSVDATGTILKQLRDEGLPLTVGLDRSLAFNQGERMTGAIRKAGAQFDADAVFALDADEFILADDRAALEAAVAAIPPGHTGQLRWALYLNDAERVIDARMVQCKAVLTRDFVASRNRPGDPAIERWAISAGNHWVGDPATGALAPSVELAGAMLAHLPFRSVAQVTQKVVLGHFAHRLALGSGEASAHINWHWRHVYRRIRERGLVDADLATLAVQSYLGGKPFEHADETAPPTTVRAPLPAVEQHYAALATVDPMASLMAWTDQLLTEAGH